MFEAIRASKYRDLVQMSKCFIASNNHTAALLSLDHALAKPPFQEEETLERVLELLSGYQYYIQEIKTLLQLKDQALRMKGIQKLLNFMSLPSAVEEQSHEYLVHRSSILQRYIPTKNSRELSGGYVVDQASLLQAIHKCLPIRYSISLQRLHLVARKLRALQPCILFALLGGVDGRCTRQACQSDHRAEAELTSTYFISRVLAHVKIIKLLDAMVPLTEEDYREAKGKASYQRCLGSHSIACVLDILPQANSVFL
jgi:hypothetical protein